MEISSVNTDLDELDQIARVNASAWAQQPTHEAITRWAKRLGEDMGECNPDYYCFFKAVRDGSIVGFARASRSSSSVSEWMFSGLVVHPAHRRVGIATALLQACARHARQKGAVLLRSETHLDNATSIAFHQAVGFRTDGVHSAADGDSKVAFSMLLGCSIQGAGDQS